MSESDLSELAYGLRFDLTQTAQYHIARAQFFSDWSRRFNFVVIVLGASIVGQLTNTTWLALATTVIAALQLVGDFSGRAAEHSALQRRAYDLMAELDSLPSPTRDEIFKIRGKLTQMYGDEPPMMKALNAIAFNTACEYMGRQSNLRAITFFENAFRNYLAFNSADFAQKAATPASGAA